jgi:hypothetical protein
VLAVGPAGAAEGPAVAVPDVVGGGCVGDGDAAAAAAAGNGERHGADGPCTASSLSHLGISDLSTRRCAHYTNQEGESYGPATTVWNEERLKCRSAGKDTAETECTRYS